MTPRVWAGAVTAAGIIALVQPVAVGATASVFVAAPAQQQGGALAGVGRFSGSVVAEAVAATMLPGPGEVVVEQPRGELGPRTADTIDPATVDGITREGSRWFIAGGTSFDEVDAGGHLVFDGPLVVQGPDVVIDGARFVDVDSGSTYVLAADRSEYGFEARHIAVEGGQGAAALGGRAENVVLTNFSIVGYDGDGLKPGNGWEVTDGRIEIRDTGAPKHYDGIQVTRSRGVTIARVDVAMYGSGTAAVFVHETDSTEGDMPNVVHDLLVSHAADLWFPLRFDRSVIAYDIQGIGPVAADNKPTALVLSESPGIDWRTVYPSFDSPVPKR